jgi:hypothetical protein
MTTNYDYYDRTKKVYKHKKEILVKHINIYVIDF